MKKEAIVYDFPADKNQWLIEHRGISFEDVVTAIEAGAMLAILPHPNIAKYPNQEVYLIEMQNYVYVVPFVTKEVNHVFLKTIFPHRKFTKQYLRGNDNEEA